MKTQQTDLIFSHNPIFALFSSVATQREQRKNQIEMLGMLSQRQLFLILRESHFLIPCLLWFFQWSFTRARAQATLLHAAHSRAPSLSIQASSQPCHAALLFSLLTRRDELLMVRAPFFWFSFFLSLRSWQGFNGLYSSLFRAQASGGHSKARETRDAQFMQKFTRFALLGLGPAQPRVCECPQPQIPVSQRNFNE